MKEKDTIDNKASAEQSKEYRALCGVCRHAPPAMEAQEKLLASQERSIEVCACKLGSYVIELDLSVPDCLRLVHTYRLREKRVTNVESRSY